MIESKKLVLKEDLEEYGEDSQKLACSKQRKEIVGIRKTTVFKLKTVVLVQVAGLKPAASRSQTARSIH